MNTPTSHQQAERLAPLGRVAGTLARAQAQSGVAATRRVAVAVSSTG